jgi:hypothetical protein
MPGSHAAHQAAQLIRQQHQVIQNNMAQQRRMRAVTFTLALKTTKTTSMGFDVVRTFTINESETVRRCDAV